MINNDSIVTAYDEHLTLVEWLQKVEVLLKNGGLKEFIINDKGNATFSLSLVFNDSSRIESNAMTLASVNGGLKDIIVNDKGNATFSLTLVFNDGSKIESNAMTLASVNEALTALNSDIDDLKKYKGFEPITYDKTNCVRLVTNLSSNFDTEEMALKFTTEVTLSASDIAQVREIILKAVHYGFVVEPFTDSYMITPLSQVTFDGDNIDACFGIPSDQGIVGYEIIIHNGNKYSCIKTQL